jgi:hypothetical protein
MEIDLATWEMHGNNWYRHTDTKRRNARRPRACVSCGRAAMMKKLQRFCTATCANTTMFSKHVVSYGGAHDRVQCARGLASDHLCNCGEQAAEWSYNGMDPDEVTGVLGQRGAGFRYSLDPSYYVPRCVSCHRGLDTKRGEEHHCAILTEDAVREIHELYASTLHLGRFDPDRWSHRKLGEEFGVDKTTVGKILTGKLWSHLSLPVLRWESSGI